MSIAKPTRPLQQSSRSQLSFQTWLVLHNVSGYGAGRHRQRTGQVHLSGAAAAGEIAILCADDHLFRPGGHARSGIDAGSATGLDHVRSRFLENVEISFADAVLARLLRSELDVKQD